MQELDFIVVTGTRERGSDKWKAIEALADELGEDWDGIVIYGDCPTGIDRAVQGLLGGSRFVAAWNRFEKRAGPLRNAMMAGAAKALMDEGLTGKCFAFPAKKRSPGTRDCIRRCRAIGLPVDEREL
jgi:hypothetical protein